MRARVELALAVICGFAWIIVFLLPVLSEFRWQWMIALWGALQ